MSLIYIANYFDLLNKLFTYRVIQVSVHCNYNLEVLDSTNTLPLLCS